MLLNDIQIEALATDRQMITPFVGEQVRVAGVSYGLSSAGYDLRLSHEFAYFAWRGTHAEPLSPGTIHEGDVVRVIADEYVIPPGGFVLAVTAEYIRMPANVVGKVCDKSSWARCGLSVQNTVIEPGWNGQITLELHNQQQCRSIRLAAGEGIAQLTLEQIRHPRTSYADRNGRYQGQTGITLPRG